MSHVHGPGCNHGPGGHDHGHSHEAGGPPGLPPAPTAEQTALSDAHFNPVDFTIDDKTGIISSPTHDLGVLNALARSIAQIPQHIGLPPPPNVVQPQRSMAINQAREQGKEAFQRKDYAEAIKLFTLAVDVAASRPLWEPAAMVRDELAVCLANRSSAFAAVEDWVDSLVDAEAVVQLKKPWLKGHYRKGLALAKMERWQEAREAYQLGLQFDPDSPVSGLSSARQSIAPPVSATDAFGPLRSPTRTCSKPWQHYRVMTRHHKQRHRCFST